MELVNRTRQLIEKIQPAYWMIENPTGQIPKQWRKYDEKFHPAEFGGWLAAPGEAYTKETCLWFSPNFPTLERREAPRPWVKHDEWIRVQRKKGQMGPKSERAANRSRTPSGFSYAVFNALFLELAAQVGGKRLRPSKGVSSSIGASTSSLLLEKLARTQSSEEKAFLWDQIREAVLSGEISGEDYYQALQTRDDVADSVLCLPSGASSVAGRRSLKPRPDVVGAKPKWRDPSVLPEVLAKQAIKVPKTYTNPNLPPAALAVGAGKYPIYVEQNPVLPMLRLEDPAAFKKIQWALCKGWLGVIYPKLSDGAKRRYAVDCAEHVLHFFEEKFPNETRPRKAIEIARLFANGQGTKGQMTQAAADAWDTLNLFVGGSVIHDQTAPWSAVRTAIDCANGTVAGTAGVNYHAPWAAHWDAWAHWGNHEDRTLAVRMTSEAKDNEHLWQADRIRHYYAQEHPEYQQPDLVGATPKQTAKLPYIGQCDTIRRRGTQAERFWQEMMRNKKPVTSRALEAACEVSAILDEGERLKDFVDRSDHGYFKSLVDGRPVWFVSSAGFEFIFAESGPEISSVGGKPKWNNPSLLPAELLKLAKRNPKAYTNPNLPLNQLLIAATTHPWLVEKNPVLDLLQLEDPVSFETLRDELAKGWRDAGVEELSDLHRRLYLVDCAQHVMPLLWSAHPDKISLQDALTVARRDAMGEASKQAVEQAEKLVLSVIRKSWVFDVSRHIISAILKALREFAKAESLGSFRYSGPSSAVFAAGNHGPDAEFHTRTLAEKCWQADQVRRYYAIEHLDYHRPHIIGGKSKWDNPMSNPEELLKLAKRNPRVYTNPNLPVNALLDGAKKYPWFIDQNPILGILSLDDPVHYKGLIATVHAGWVSSGLDALWLPSKLLCCADFADHVLPLYQATSPSDGRSLLVTAIETTRRYARGEATFDEMVSAAKAAYKLLHYTKAYSACPERCVVQAACFWVLDTAESRYGEAAKSASDARRHAVLVAHPERSLSGREEAWGALLEERAWQANRVRFYYAIEHPEYTLPESIGRARPQRKNQ